MIRTLVVVLMLSITAATAQAETNPYMHLYNKVTAKVTVLSVGLTDALGLYYPSSNTMLINANQTAKEWWSTLVHETVHMIQDCHAGFDNADMKPVKEMDVHKEDMLHESPEAQESMSSFVNLYQPEDHSIEMEAEFRARHTHIGSVIADFDKYCK